MKISFCIKFFSCSSDKNKNLLFKYFLNIFDFINKINSLFLYFVFIFISFAILLYIEICLCIIL